MSFFSGSLPGTTTAHELVMSIRRKCTPDEVLTVLNTLPGTGDDELFNPLKIDVFVQTLLNLGSKSFSHSFAAIGKFHYVFKVKYFLCSTIISVYYFSKLIYIF